MKSPFPGVDPYLESQHYWPDFHVRFITAWSEALSDVLPGDYEARIDERVQIIETDDKQRSYLPDVTVVHGGEKRGADLQHKGAATVEAVTLDLPIMEEIRERWVEILHRPEKRVVAVLELLSPTNKVGEGRGQYLSKRTTIFSRSVHMVEVDLLLGGERLPMRQALPAGDYFVIVSRNEQRRKGDVYAWKVRDRLPVIPIPLLKPDKDIFVDLGSVFATAYERGRYTRSIDYGVGLNAPLDEAGKRWAEGLGKAQAKA